MNKSDVPITEDNYELLLKKYQPVLFKTIKEVGNQYNRQVDFDDLHQEASIGLLKAIRAFNPSTGVFFGVYLKTVVLNQLRCYCRNTLPHRYVKDPENEGKFLYKAIQVTPVESFPEV